MVLPQTVHHHASREVTCAMLWIGHPVGETRAGETASRPTFGRIDAPVIGLISVAHQYLQVGGCGDFFLLMHIAAVQDVRFWIEMRKAAIIRMVAHMRQAFTRD